MIKRQQSFAGERRSGTLYLVATPIGNLDDMTFRAVKTLKDADVIAAEDTRRTRKLTAHYRIATPLVSYREHNHKRQGPLLVDRLLKGESVALVSDAGLPALSDPGAALVQDAIQHDVAVVPIPGANAALSALIASGLSTDRFLFLGFLPRARKKCEETLRQWKAIDATVLLYEAPHRLLKTLKLIQREWGNRRGALVREMTKRYEEWLRGTVEELIAVCEQAPPRGEYTLVIEGGTGDSREAAAEEAEWWHDLSLREHVDHVIQCGESTRDAITQVAKARGMRRRDVYNAYHRPY